MVILFCNVTWGVCFPCTPFFYWRDAVAGRPSELTDKVMKQAKQLALLGCTDKQMADIWGVSETTITNWKKQYPPFLASIKSGKEEADAKIAEALYHRAKGYKRKETKVFCQNGEIITHEYEEHMPPDTAAAFIWLKNRQGKNWKDRHEQGEASEGPKYIQFDGVDINAV